MKRTAIFSAMSGSENDYPRKDLGWSTFLGGLYAIGGQFVGSLALMLAGICDSSSSAHFGKFAVQMSGATLAGWILGFVLTQAVDEIIHFRYQSSTKK